MTKITVLTENNAGAGYLAEFGLSYHIECCNKKILFDTGHTDVFLRNATKAGMDILHDIKTVVLSHGHWDHGDGLQYLSEKTLIAHPSAFIKRFRKNGTTHIGLKLDKEALQKKFTIIASSQPYYLDENIIYLGEIPRKNNFESLSTIYVDENNNEDFIPDDSALAIKMNEEIIVITGCSHSGICNIIEYAKHVTGIDKIAAVIGGFHLKKADELTQKTIEYLKRQNIRTIIPSHCTELPALCMLHDHFKFMPLKTGDVLNF